MSYSISLSIYVNNTNINPFYFSYNENSDYFDLLEYFSFLNPKLNICPCYKIQCYYYNNYNYSWVDIYMNDKFINFNSYNNNLQFILNNKEKKCKCNDAIKKYFKEKKNIILDNLNKIYLENKFLQDEIIYKEQEIQNYQNSENDLTFQNSCLQKEKMELNGKIFDLNQSIKNIENLNQNKDKEINNLKLQIRNLNNTIYNLQNQNANLIKEKKQLEDSIFKVVDKIESLGNKNELAKKEINHLKLEIENQNKQKLIDEKKIEEFKQEKEQLKKEREENIQLNKDTIFTDFYDVIIDIKSIKDINKGWKIKMSEKAKQNYDNYKKEENLKIGIIGNANKGKSFLLSKISKIKLPSSTSIRTEGLSIKYPELEGFENRKIVLLDSAGLETPLLKDEFEITSNDEKEEEKKEKELFREKSREKLITELFLQNFIINNSDVLIIVVGILTYSEQKLLNRIKTEFLKIRNKTKIDKPLFIIHNLMTYEIIGQVEEYINDFLLKSATFDLKVGHNISTKGEKKKGIYYYEKNLNQKIFHLIFARDKTEAGDFYNDSTLDFFENNYQSVINLKGFNVIEEVKDNFIKISGDILEKTETPFNLNNFDNSNKELIKLTNANNITLKKCLIDELGFSNLKANSFEPTYNYYIKDNKMIIGVEAPGNCTLKSTFESGAQYNIIKINGTKKKDKYPEKITDNIVYNREFGNFTLDIPISLEYIFKNKPPEVEQKRGVIFITYDLEEKNKDGEITVKEDEEI